MERWRVRSQVEPTVSYARVVRRYSSAVKNGPWQTRPWVLGLPASLEAPWGWPRGLDWGRHRDDWGRLLAAAQAVLEGLSGTPCPGASHYGSVSDGRPSGHARVHCAVPTGNLFWRRSAR